MKGNVLVLSERYGGGHTKAALALQKRFSQYNVHTLELSNYLQPILFKSLQFSYSMIISQTPTLWRKIYQSGISQTNRIPQLYSKVYAKKLQQLIVSYRPEVIFTTHPFPAAMLQFLPPPRPPIIGVVTDFHIHQSWINAGCDLLCTPTGEKLDDVYTMPALIPVAPHFAEKIHPLIAKQFLQVPQHKQTVLWMGGSDGIFPAAEQLEPLKQAVQYEWLMVTGKNEKLYKQLTKQFAEYPHVRIYRFVEQISLFMDAADVIVTKPGGVTCTEAIMKEKPLVLYPGVTGHEEMNATFLSKRKMALAVPVEHIITSLERLLSQHDLLREMTNAMRVYKQETDTMPLQTLIETYRQKNYAHTY